MASWHFCVEMCFLYKPYPCIKVDTSTKLQSKFPGSEYQIYMGFFSRNLSSKRRRKNASRDHCLMINCKIQYPRKVSLGRTKCSKLNGRESIHVDFVTVACFLP